MAETVWFEFVESKQLRQLTTDLLASIQLDLVRNPERGAIVKGTHGVRKARVADPASSQGKSSSYRYLYLILNTRGEFTCCIYSARENKLICPLSKCKSLVH
jgi:hypothetical protein